MSLLTFSLEPHVPVAVCPEHGEFRHQSLLGREHSFCMQCGTRMDVQPGAPFENTEAPEAELMQMLAASVRKRSLIASLLDNHVGLHGLFEVGGDRGDESRDVDNLWDLVFQAGWMRLGLGKGEGPQWKPNARARDMCETIGIYGIHNSNKPAGARPF